MPHKRINSARVLKISSVLPKYYLESNMNECWIIQVPVFQYNPSGPPDLGKFTDFILSFNIHQLLCTGRAKVLETYCLNLNSDFPQLVD